MSTATFIVHSKQHMVNCLVSFIFATVTPVDNRSKSSGDVQLKSTLQFCITYIHLIDGYYSIHITNEHTYVMQLT